MRWHSKSLSLSWHDALWAIGSDRTIACKSLPTMHQYWHHDSLSLGPDDALQAVGGNCKAGDALRLVQRLKRHPIHLACTVWE